MSRSGQVSLLTAGNDPHYSLGLARALASRGLRVDLVCSDELDTPEHRGTTGLQIVNLRGDQREDVGVAIKAARILRYYTRLLRYTAVGAPPILHILWNNKRFEYFDRTVLMAYYRLLRKRTVMTAHNVNAARRDGNDSWLNRITLKFQYRLCHHVFVHTDRMKQEIVREFTLPSERVSVIPYGINDAVPVTDLSRSAARARLDLAATDTVLLAFGQIAPYKGLEYLLDALELLHTRGLSVRLMIAGKVKPGWTDYWKTLDRRISSSVVSQQVVRRISFVPDEEIEWYFKAADALVLPYTDIFQSGVLALAYSFGLPVIATDVGSLKEHIIEGQSGFVCPPRDPAALAAAIARYLESDLRNSPDRHRERIRALADAQHSWQRVGEITAAAYARLADPPGHPRPLENRVRP